MVTMTSTSDERRDDDERRARATSDVTDD